MTLADQYYYIIILCNIIDALFRQFKTNTQYSLQTINNTLKYQILINRIDHLEATLGYR